MKKLPFIVFILIFNSILFSAKSNAQSTGISYQAVVRNGSGILQTNTELTLRLSVITESSATTHYSEEHTIRTDAYGWVNATLGTGRSIGGDLNSIDWPSTIKTLRVECRPSGSSTFSLLGTSVINPIPLRGSKGEIGVTGAKGDKGNPGIQGLKGDPGSQGPKGDKGDAGTGVKIVGSIASQANLLTPYSGAIGDLVIAQDNGNGHVWDGTRWNNVGQIKGPKGDQGIQGLQGLAGAKGDKGDIGEPGLRGEQGIQGIQGPAGIKGDKGDTGPEGPRGLQGIPGTNGINGLDGAKGDKGDKGDQGIQGIQGPIGPTGTSANAWDKAGNVGTNPSVNFMGTSDNVDLKIKRNNVDKLILTNEGIDIPGNTILHLGAGIASKSTDAGKIGYNVFGEGDKLSIVGSGTAASGADRKIKLWAEGGIFHRGPLKMERTSDFIELGSLGVTKEINAGKIFYNPDEGLVFFGAGTNTLNRKVRFWAEGGTAFEGSATFNGGIRLAHYTGTPSAGFIRYNSTTNEFEGYNGTSWKLLSGGGTGTSTLWSNSLLGSNTIHNATTTNRVLIAQNPGSVFVAGNQVLTVAADTANQIASFITTNVKDDTKAVEIINQGSSAAFARPIALNIENVPHAQAGIGIKVKSGGTGIEINSGLVALRANGSTAGPGSIFTGGIGLTATGQGTGIISSAASAANNSTGVLGQYTGNGSFDGVGIEGLALPTGATVPNGKGFGYGGKFTGGNKGIYAEMKANPSSLYLTDLRNYTKYYGSEDRPMAGLFKSSGSIGIMAIATDFHRHNPSNEPYSIGLVGRSNAPGTAVKNIGVYGEGEGVGERVGVMGYADSTNTSLAIGIRGIAKGTLGIAGEFKAAEGLHVEGDRIGLHVIAPTNEISGASTSPLLTLQRSATTPGEVLNLNNGYLKVSGTTKTAFVHTAVAANIRDYLTVLSYPGATNNDILIVTHQWNGANIAPHIGVWWNGTNWTIYRQDQGPMPLNAKFNVLIIKQ